MFRHIVCPIDGSGLSLQALDTAAQFAAEQCASLTVCTIVDPAKAAAMAFGDPGMSAACFEAMREEGKALVEDAVTRVQPVIEAHTVILDGQPVQSILDYTASGNFDLIIMGSHGRSGIQRALLGSVAEGVLRHATLPVMIVRGAAKPAAAIA